MALSRSAGLGRATRPIRPRWPVAQRHVKPRESRDQTPSRSEPSSPLSRAARCRLVLSWRARALATPFARQQNGDEAISRQTKRTHPASCECACAGRRDETRRAIDRFQRDRYQRRDTDAGVHLILCRCARESRGNRACSVSGGRPYPRPGVPQNSRTCFAVQSFKLGQSSNRPVLAAAPRCRAVYKNWKPK